MWDTSKSPAALRTASCSWRMPEYCTGMTNPAKGTILALSATCVSCRGVFFPAVILLLGWSRGGACPGYHGRHGPWGGEPIDAEIYFMPGGFTKRAGKPGRNRRNPEGNGK